jgi:CMP-N-acetylneuraminic acid synthetase
MAHSIEQALASTRIHRTVVSTDSEAYAEIARKYGAEVPFLRPPELSGDLSTDLEVFQHGLAWLEEKEGYLPDVCVHLRPTSPLRKVADIDMAVQIILEHPEIDSVRSVSAAPHTPYKMWRRDEEGFLAPVSESDIGEPYNLPRQALLPVFLQNGVLDVIRTEVVRKRHSMTGRRIYGWVMEECPDIDTEQDFREAAERLNEGVHGSEGLSFQGDWVSRTLCFDIDGVLATVVPGNRYDRATPLRENIRLVNALFDAGHRIILFTARGSVTGKDWKEITHRQMTEWGVRFHDLRFGKPGADYYVDDKMIGLGEIRRWYLSRGQKDPVGGGCPS